MNSILSKNLKILLKSTNKQIIEKNLIKFYFPMLLNQINWIDYVLITDEFNICVGNCYDNSLNNLDINSYGNFTNNINISNEKKFYFVILKKSKKIVNLKNSTNSINSNKSEKTETDEYNNIFSNPFELRNKNFKYLFEIESSNISNLLNKLSCLLYSNNIFLYDYDGSSFMINFID